MPAVKIALCICSYKGPDVACFDNHLEFLHYLGRLQERSYWMPWKATIGLDHMTNSPDPAPPLERMGLESAELRPGDPVFEFCTVTLTGLSLIGKARDNVVSRALEAGCDYVFFWDDDMILSRDCLLRLWRHQKPFVSALAFTARDPITPVIYQFERKFRFDKRVEEVDIKPVFRYERDALIQVDAVGTGVVLIHTDVFREIEKPWFDGHISAGEDVHFCYKLWQAGIPVFVDTSVKTLHRRNEPVWQDELRYLDRIEEAEAVYEKDLEGQKSNP